MKKQQQLPRKKNKYQKINSQQVVHDRINRHLHVGIFIYIVVLLYIFLLAYNFMTKQPMSAMVVEKGRIEENANFKAMILRDEKIVFAKEKGEISFLAPSGSKLQIHHPICVVNRNEETKKLTQSKIYQEKDRLAGNANLSKREFRQIQTELRDYRMANPTNPFVSLRQVKDNLSRQIDQYKGYLVVNDMTEYNRAIHRLEEYQHQIKSNGTVYYSTTSGLIDYSFDGMEDIQLDNFKLEDFKRQPQVINRLDKPQIEAGWPLFKEVDNLHYYFVSEIDAFAMRQLENKKNGYVTLSFPTKGIDVTVKIIQLEKRGESYIAVFQADRYFSKFNDHRFIDYAINYVDVNGLKVPNTAIVKRDLFKIPQSAISKTIKGDYQIQKKQLDAEKTGGETLIPFRVKIYLKNDDDKTAYILPIENQTSLTIGDEIAYFEEKTGQSSLNGQFYRLSAKEPLDGVYVLNKGYADFKPVIIDYNTDNYSLVRQNQAYSIQIYDKIATDATNLEEFTGVN